MLKHREKLDILEDYCGEYSEYFQWIPPKKLAGETNFTYAVEGKLNNIMAKVSLCDNIVVVRFYHNTKSSIKLADIPLADPNGKTLVELKLKQVFDAFATEDFIT